MVAMTDSTALAERYGRGGRGSRGTNLVLAVAALAGVVLVAVTVWSFLVEADPDVRSALQTYDVVSDHEVVAELVVTRASEDVRATCRLHAVAEDHSTVGRAEARLIRSRDLVDVVVKKLREDPMRFLCEPGQCDECDLARAHA